MKAQVLKVIETNQKFNIAHCRVGNLYGTVIATKAVHGPGEWEFKTALREKAGRLVVDVLIDKE